jgi:hypothetical protein
MIIVNDGFGVGDIWSFLFWSMPFAAGVAVLARLLRRLCCRLSPLVTYLVAALSGALSGVVWTFVVALFLGSWFGAFSFPVFSCWMAGGASGMVSASTVHENGVKRRVVLELAFVALICVSAVLGTAPFFTYLSTDQNLHVIFVQWKLGAEPLSVKDLDALGVRIELTEKELAQLKAIGITGHLTVVGGSEHGNGKHSRAVIIMQHQITDAVELLQPDGAEVIYLQDGNEWKMYPSDAPTLRRVIRLEVAPISPRNTQCLVELSYGAMQGGLAFSW